MIKRIMILGLVGILAFRPITVKADSATVVTIGADLSDTQRETMFEYFGVDENKVAVLEVNNKEERQYLEGIAPEKQIGTRTYSCAYIEPMDEGNGINVKMANLNWVTASMIASTLVTAGITDVNVVAAAPFEVSGTGALTGIMKAFEDITGDELDEEKKELATEELITTGTLAEDIGQDNAAGIMNDVKDAVIAQDISDAVGIEEQVNDSAEKYGISLTDDQVALICSTMEKIAAQDYDYSKIKNTLNTVSQNVADKLGLETNEEKVGFFKKIGNWFGGLFNKEDKEELNQDTNLGILENTNDAALGEDVITDATDEGVLEDLKNLAGNVSDKVSDIDTPSKEETVGFFTKVVNYFKGLFE